MNKIDKLIQIVKRGAAEEIEGARDLVNQEDMPALVQAYWTLTSWEDKSGMMQLFSDYIAPNGKEVMLDYLTIPPAEPGMEDYVAISKAVALSQLEGSFDNAMKYYDDRQLLEKTARQYLQTGGAPKSPPYLKHSERSKRGGFLSRLFKGKPQIEWQVMSRLPDGRVFVSDRSLLLDKDYAQPKKLPNETVPAETVEKLLTWPTRNTFTFEHLSRDSNGNYRGLHNIIINGKYVDFLTSIEGYERLHFYANEALDPVLIVDGGNIVGVVMPMKE